MRLELCKISIILTLLSACSSETPHIELQPKAQRVRVATARVQDLPLEIEAIGQLRPSRTVEIRPQVTGMLQEILTTEGQWVTKGTPLFKIDPSIYANKVKELTALCAKDRVACSLHEKKLERYRSLSDKELIPQIEWDELEVEVAKAKSLLEEDTARLDAALLDLHACLVTAPSDGRVGTLEVHEGNMISKGDRITRLVLLNPLIVEWEVTEKEFHAIHQKELPIHVASLISDEINAKGTITFLENQFDEKSGLLKVRGRLYDPPATFRAGQHVRVRVPIDLIPSATLIPQKALRYQEEGASIAIVQNDDTIAYRSVKLGQEYGDEVVVVEGLDANMRICIEGHQQLYAGAKVEVCP